MDVRNNIASIMTLLVVVMRVSLGSRQDALSRILSL